MKTCGKIPSKIPFKNSLYSKKSTDYFLFLIFLVTFVRNNQLAIFL